MPALVSGAGAEVAVVDAVVAAFLVVVVSPGVVAAGAEVGAVVAGALVSAGAVVVAAFLFTVVVGAVFVVFVLFVVFAAVFATFGAAAADAVDVPFLVIADLIVVGVAALASVAVRNNPLSVTATAKGIRFDREGIIPTAYRIIEARPRINGNSPGHSAPNPKRSEIEPQSASLGNREQTQKEPLTNPDRTCFTREVDRPGASTQEVIPSDTNRWD